MPKRRPQIGDVFAIKIGDLFCYGQIAARGPLADCVIAFDFASAKLDTVSDVASKSIAFVMLTVDAFVASGRWPVIGNASPPINLILPEYIADTRDSAKVYTWQGKALRKATPEDLQRLGHMESESPVVLEKALRARFAGAQWEPRFDRLVYKAG